MREGLRFKTEESGIEILEGLSSEDGNYFECRILIPKSGPDWAGTALLPLWLEPLRGREVSYVAANGDRIYRTTGRFKQEGESFPVDVTIHSRVADMTGAVIAMASEALAIFQEEGR